ncbi:MAG: general secretion pathway protein GspK [Deltaproteobacteria bacterium]|nr:general secretion pathway protein GspK [Deltaproteobacteria bacterium]MBW2013430.1 general secretion pathway protein GspK [Deltaproteobacteria bacterium]MBW2088402.1 general secretion pathway protein GspK [Deltaproteobacteria bacterium]MBW2320712.1 general secretion pathway protein GspK [Deltaproteobacteria bacterium]
MPDKILRNHRGIALLVTVTIITILIAVALEMNRKTRSVVFSAAASRDRITLSHMASSGIDIAKAILIKDRNHSDFDSLQEDWADSKEISELLQDMPFEDGDIKLTITDELGKIQINSLVTYPDGHIFNESQRDMWHRFLHLVISQNESLEDLEPDMIINSVKDWIDSGDDEAITGLNGAESDYYQELDPPYVCRNGPFIHIGELALIKGITTEYWQLAGGVSGISRYMTVFGASETSNNKFTYEGKININTADLPVLVAMLPSGNPELAQAIYDYRLETSDSEYIHNLSSTTWYKQVPGLSDVEIDPKIITTTSDIFRIESFATLHDIKMKITAMVKREQNKKTGKWECSVLSWKTE